MSSTSLTPTPIRLPADLRAWLKQQAQHNQRSLNKEIVFRLEQSRTAEGRQRAAND